MKKTDKIGNAPVIHALVNEPRVLPIVGKKVLISAPNSNGTNIIPPGIRSMDFLICIIVPPFIKAQLV